MPKTNNQSNCYQMTKSISCIPSLSKSPGHYSLSFIHKRDGGKTEGLANHIHLLTVLESFSWTCISVTTPQRPQGQT